MEVKFTIEEKIDNFADWFIKNRDEIGEKNLRYGLIKILGEKDPIAWTAEQRNDDLIITLECETASPDFVGEFQELSRRIRIKWLSDKSAAEYIDEAEAFPDENQAVDDPLNDPSKPWNQIPDHGYDRLMLYYWHKGYKAREIGKKIDNQAGKTITNRLSILRGQYSKFVPRDDERR